MWLSQSNNNDLGQEVVMPRASKRHLLSVNDEISDANTLRYNECWRHIRRHLLREYRRLQYQLQDMLLLRKENRRLALELGLSAAATGKRAGYSNRFHLGIQLKKLDGSVRRE